MGIIKTIVQKQPKLIKNLYYNIVPFRYRYDKLFGETYDFLKNVDTWGFDRTKEYQFIELKNLLIYCYNHVPFYKKLFSEYEFNPKIQSFEDMNKLPYLTKDIIQNNFNELISTNYFGKKILFKTSGSTGKRLEFYGENSMYKKEAAYILHSFESHNAELYNNWSIWIRRHSPKDDSDLIVKDYELKRIYMSPFHLNDVTIYNYVNIINNSKSTTIVTYPSTAYWLSCLLEKHNLKLYNIKSIHGASEQCLDIWGKKIKDIFGFGLKMHYGQVEKVSFLYQSSISDFYHESLTYSYTEYDDDNIIVGTSFMNRVMPLIRYKTNDVVTLLKTQDKSLSSPIMVEKIDGRVDDMIISENGTKIPSVNFYTVMSKCDEVKMFQLHQQIDKSLILKLVVSNNFNNKIKDNILLEIKKRVGDLSLQFKIVDEIIRDNNTGKFRCVITDIK
jgi:phenylacetate-CoA ligase